MTRAQTLFVILLTAAYLLVELAFNSRLLDVAGGLDAEAVHGLENFGRSLSGIAVALFVLQRQLGKRATSVDRSPSGWEILARCAFWAVVTFFALKMVVEVLVDTSTGEFRKASATLVIVRTEMLRGEAQMDGLDDDPRLFERPEGKAFAALFPVLGMQIWERVDQRLAGVRDLLLQRAVSSQLGGPRGFYEGPYRTALNELKKTYRGDLPQDQFDRLVAKEDEKAWNEYTDGLRKHHWTPTTIPFGARRRVADEVRAKVPVPRNWAPYDRAGFHAAVAERVRSDLRASAGTVYDKDRVVAKGLSWTNYVEHPAIQRHLRQALRIPEGVLVRADYQSGAEFDTGLFKPMVQFNASGEKDCLALDSESFSPGGRNSARGREAAQAVLVAPIALLCSLMGAIAHLAKLLYQMTRLVVGSVPGLVVLRKYALLVPAGVVVCTVVTISLADNAITASRVHRFIREQALEGASDAGSKIWVWAVLDAMHAIEIGQGYGYPVNSYVRSKVLGGFSFDLGRQEGKKSASEHGPTGCQVQIRAPV